ncbi:hypothetical protein HpBT333_13150 [Helicobacter pylori]
MKLLLLWYLQTNQNLKNYLLVLANCDKKGTYNMEIELVSKMLMILEECLEKC